MSVEAAQVESEDADRGMQELEWWHGIDGNSLITAIRCQNNLSLFLPIDRATMPALSFKVQSHGAENNEEPFGNNDVLEFLLKNVVRRLLIDIYYDQEERAWVLYEKQTSANSNARSRKKYHLEKLISHIQKLTLDGETQSAVIVIIFNLKDSLSNNVHYSLAPNGGKPMQKRARPISTAFDTKTLYTPKMLEEFRTSGFLDEPSAYYSPIKDKDGKIVRIDGGWPSGLSLVGKKKTLLVGVNTEDLVLNEPLYNFDYDSDLMFTSQYLNGTPLMDIAKVKINKNNCNNPAPNLHMHLEGTAPKNEGKIIQYNKLDRNPWYWPYYFYDNRDDDYINFDEVEFLSKCGFQPVFTQNAPKAIIKTALWSWDTNQPLNPSNYNCATINSTSGRWSSAYCSASRPVACSYVGNSTAGPNSYNWVITNNTPFTDAASSCPDGFEFHVPHAPRENYALVNVMLEKGLKEVWVNIVQMKPYCWVHRIEVECPYNTLKTPKGATKPKTETPKHGVYILAISVLFLIYKIRKHLKTRRLNKRRTTALSAVKKMDYSTYPA